MLLGPGEYQGRGEGEHAFHAARKETTIHRASTGQV